MASSAPPPGSGWRSGSRITLASAGGGPSSSTLAPSPTSSSSPCAACKFLRRKCTQGCVFAPYFPPDQPNKFVNVHKVFGASNITKLLNGLEPKRREEAVTSLAYEADCRLQDPVYGCAGYISLLQGKLRHLHECIAAANNELALLLGPDLAALDGGGARSVHHFVTNAPGGSVAALSYQQLYDQQEQQLMSAQHHGNAAAAHPSTFIHSSYAQQLGGSMGGGGPSASNMPVQSMASGQRHLMLGGMDHGHHYQQQELMNQDLQLTTATGRDQQDLWKGYDQAPLQAHYVHQQHEYGGYVKGSGGASSYHLQQMEQGARGIVSVSGQQSPELGLVPAVVRNYASNYFHPAMQQQQQMLHSRSSYGRHPQQKLKLEEQEDQDPYRIHHGHGAQRDGSDSDGKGDHIGGGGILGLS